MYKRQEESDVDVSASDDLEDSGAELPAEQPIKEAARARAKAANLNFFMVITSFIPVSIQENQENINYETTESSLFH